MTTTLRPVLPSDIDVLWVLRTVAVRVSCATHYAPEQIAVWTATPVPASYAAMLDVNKQEVDAVFVDPSRARH